MTIRERPLESTDLHTILRLPTGIFCAQGVKANVLSFDNKPASRDPWTKHVRVCDYRTNIKHTPKTNTLRNEHLTDFVRCHNPENRHQHQETERFRTFSCADVVARDKISIDIFWLKDDSLSDLGDLPHPDELATSIVDNLEAALSSIRSVVARLWNKTIYQY